MSSEPVAGDRVDHDIGGRLHRGPGKGLGEGGERLHYWVFDGPAWPKANYGLQGKRGQRRHSGIRTVPRNRAANAHDLVVRALFIRRAKRH